MPSSRKLRKDLTRSNDPHGESASAVPESHCIPRWIRRREHTGPGGDGGPQISLGLLTRPGRTELGLPLGPKSAGRDDDLMEAKIREAKILYCAMRRRKSGVLFDIGEPGARGGWHLDTEDRKGAGGRRDDETPAAPHFGARWLVGCLCDEAVGELPG